MRTVFNYVDGVLVEAVTVAESEFSREDVELLMAVDRVETDIGPHGVPMSEALDPKNQGKFQVKIFSDFAQQAIDRTRKKHQEDLERAGVPSSGFIYVVQTDGA